MTPVRAVRDAARMRNMMILAITAIGAVRIIWSVLSPVEAGTFAVHWAADE